MKKILLTLLSVVFALCLIGAVACNGNSGNYHSLIFSHADGVEYVLDSGLESGMEVKDGVTVRFSLKIDEEATGDPAVYANEDRLYANEDGVYSVKIVTDTIITVKGVESYGEYSQLVFDYTYGVTFTPTNEGLKNGMMVRRGSRVEFSISVAEGYDGTPVVYANDEILVPDDRGFYSFILERETHVRCENIAKNIEVLFDSGEETEDGAFVKNLVSYVDANGKNILTDTNLPYRTGDVIRFKPKLSVYLVDNYPGYTSDEDATVYQVTANDNVLKPDNEGFYSWTIASDLTRIALYGLVQDTPFTARNDGGSGTQADPFRISKPIDLYQLSAMCNSAFWTEDTYRHGYYELVNDIDLQGEQLYIIGDMSNSYAYFGGVFNGNGHTISNYKIIDTVVDQESYLPMYLRYVGMFGYVIPGSSVAPSIYNLHLDNFILTANNYTVSHELYAGGLIGMGYGVDIVGCSVTNGKMEITGGNIRSNNEYAAYIGGLIGQQTSAATADGSIYLYSGVTSCYVDVDIHVDEGYVFCAGGITGLLAVASEALSAYVLNSYSTGEIEGSVRAGGIVGYAAPGTSVVNCYSTGDIYSTNSLLPGQVQDSSVCYSYAGGIVGHAGYNTVVYNCFALGDVVGNADAGQEYAETSYSVAYRDHGDDLSDVDAREPVVLRCYNGNDDDINESFILNTMGWSIADWTFVDGLPTINHENSDKKFTISFSADGFGSTLKPFVVDSDDGIPVHQTMSNWYMYQEIFGEGIPEFVIGSGYNRSYGYFFDKDLKYRVPYSFIPTGDITLYVGYADHSKIIGTYYLGNEFASTATLEFDMDGMVTLRDGAMNHTTAYIYNGESIIIKYSAIGALSSILAQMNDKYIVDYYLSTYYNFIAKVDNGNRIALSGGYVAEVERVLDNKGNLTNDLVSTGRMFMLFDEDSPLVGLKGVEGFKYGSYKNGDTVYIFKGNGTGELAVNGNRSAFTYTIDEINSKLTIVIGVKTVEASFSNGVVTEIDELTVNPYDGFGGNWETQFNIYETYYFDGLAFINDGVGAWTYAGYDGTANGTYKIENGELKATGDKQFTAIIDENTGFLVITEGKDKTTYYKDGSFVGGWYFNASSNPVTVNLNGIGDSGFGEVEVVSVFGQSTYMTYAATIADDGKSIVIYYNDILYAAFKFDADKLLLTGTLNGVAARLSVYDILRGTWISNDGDMYAVEFNGNGYYSEDSTKEYMEIKSRVYITTIENGKTKRERANNGYILSRETNQGEFTYKDVVYGFSYNVDTGAIDVTVKGKTITLGGFDGWYGNDLVDEDGYIYTFNGRGDLVGGGTLTARRSSTEIRGYNYKINDDESITLKQTDGISYDGRIYMDESVEPAVWIYEYVIGGETKKVTLTRSTPFTGEWLIGGEPGKINIGKIYANNKAQGSYQFYGENEPTEVEFTYHPQEQYLSFPYGNSTYYVNSYSANATELSIGPDINTTSSRNSTCIPAGSADVWYNQEYFILDGVDGAETGERVVFDGLSNSKYGNGTVLLYLKRYEYRPISYVYINHNKESKYAQIRMDDKRYLFVPVEQGVDYGENVLYYLRRAEEVPGANGSTTTVYHHYILTRPDGLMDEEIKDRFLPGVTYKFDGVMEVERTNLNGSIATFNYKLDRTKDDTESRLYTVTFKTKTQGNETATEYEVYLNYFSEYKSEWTIFMPNLLGEIKEKGSGATYRFIDNDTIVRKVAGASTTYKFTVENYEDDSEAQDYVYVLNLTREAGDGKDKATESFKIALNVNSDKSADWFVTVFDKMHGLTLADKYGREVIYKFDGEGTVTRVYMDDTTEKFTYKLTDGVVASFTDEEGNEYKVEIDMSSANSAEWTVMVYGLKINDKFDENVYYVFKDSTTLVVYNGDKTEEYTYVTAINKGTYIHTMALVSADSIGYAATLNMSSKSPAGWYILVYDKSQIKDNKEDGVYYVFSDSKTLVRHSGEETVEFTYTFVSSDNYSHRLTLRDGRGYNHVAILSTSGARESWNMLVYDILRDLSISDKFANGVTYSFDGVNNATVNNNGTKTEYKYVISKDYSTITLTADGKETLTLSLDFSARNSADWFIIVLGTEVKSGNAETANATYKFESGSTLVYTNGGEVAEYHYVFVSSNRGTHALKLTDSNGNEFTARLVTADADPANWTLTVDNTAENVGTNSYNQTVSLTINVGEAV